MSARTRLFLGNLSSAVQRPDIEEAFGKYGPIRDITIKGQFGFVEYENGNDAEEAKENLDGVVIQNEKLRIEFAKQRDGSGRDPDKTSKCFNCGKEGHWARDCRSSDLSGRCYKCGKQGHRQNECTSQRSNYRSRSRSFSRSPPRQDHRSSGRYRRSYSRSPSRSNSRSPRRRYNARSPPRGRRTNRYSRSRSRSPPRSHGGGRGGGRELYSNGNDRKPAYDSSRP